jgi:hypothetical protein
LPIVVVLPAPLTPTMSTTVGWCVVMSGFGGIRANTLSASSLSACQMASGSTNAFWGSRSWSRASKIWVVFGPTSEVRRISSSSATIAGSMAFLPDNNVAKRAIKPVRVALSPFVRNAMSLGAVSRSRVFVELAACSVVLAWSCLGASLAGVRLFGFGESFGASRRRKNATEPKAAIRDAMISAMSIEARDPSGLAAQSREPEHGFAVRALLKSCPIIICCAPGVVGAARPKYRKDVSLGSPSLQEPDSRFLAVEKRPSK